LCNKIQEPFIGSLETLNSPPFLLLNRLTDYYFMNYQRLNVISGWIVWAIATIVYVLTLEPTMPFWDCGEFIASAYKLEVGHPPGAPLFMLIGRFFSAMVGGNTELVAYMVNMISALASSFTILFLFWTITHLAKKLADLIPTATGNGKTIAILGSGIIGALVYTFSDSFWFSAVEGEVYALSSLFTAVVFWAILKWESVVTERGDLRWIILIAYLMGLSIGIHLLNLLAIPAICFVYYFKKYPTSIKGIITTGAISLALLGLIQVGIIIWFVKLAGWFERTFVNSFGLPFNSGAIFYGLLVISLIVLLLWYTRQKSMVGLNTLILGVAVAIIGYTSFATIIVRSQANTPMDENNPENLFALLSYLNREQYGDRPLLHGQYFNTPTNMTEPYKDGADVWVKSFSVLEDNTRAKLVLSCRAKFEATQYVEQNPEKKLKIVEEYIESGEKKGSVPNYRPEFCGLFPRMHSSQANHLEDYKTWSNYQDWNSEKGRQRVEAAEEGVGQYEYAVNYYSQTGKMPKGLEGTDPRTLMKSLDRMQLKMIPSAGEDIRYFIRYQLGFMYMRYFMWNFAGKQNDKQSHGEFTNGNWISGITTIDQQRLGDREHLSEIEANNRGFNKYFYLPLLFGLFGLIYQLLKHPKDFSVVTLLFLLTGVAIVVYLNQTPQQPRERDYAYSGSFYAFTIWIGLGVMALYDAACSMTLKQLGTLSAMTLGGSIVIFGVESAASDTATLGYSLVYMSIITILLFATMTAIHLYLKKGSALAGIAPVLLLLIAPVLMGAYNWDDHTRAKRETGIAMAVNYLESLQPNAIIFTNGDNDTFPLWYAQEVEGIRTDVRVVNLSLLNTDWYIDQMKRRAYESAPVPFKMPEQKYRQGTRDVLFLDPNKETKDFLPIAEALKVALDDSKFIDNGRNKIAYFPSYKFRIAVDPNVAETFRPFMKEGDSLVTNIDFQVVDGNGKPKSFLTKAQMMTLDLLNNLDWSRPVYFAVTTGGDAYMGLERYFQLEGLAYRLTPILHKRSDNPNLDGGIGTDLMYGNMMEKFRWGNMDTEDIYMDENNRRMTTNLRLQFGHLAEQLIAENKLDSARKVLLRSLEVMPEKNVPYEQPQIMWQVADMLYQAGDSAKALELSLRLYDLSKQEINYYNNLDPVRQMEMERNIKTRVQIADRLALLARDYRPYDPSVMSMTEEVNGFLEEFKVPSYEDFLNQEKEMNEMKRVQDSMMQNQRKKTETVFLGGDKGIKKSN